ncbi:MAG TPA: hypothetical protein VGE52_13645, partial [Pirellulales bacterium]
MRGVSLLGARRGRAAEDPPPRAIDEQVVQRRLHPRELRGDLSAQGRVVAESLGRDAPHDPLGLIDQLVEL